jgi:hypothetical protein
MSTNGLLSVVSLVQSIARPLADAIRVKPDAGYLERLEASRAAVKRPLPVSEMVSLSQILSLRAEPAMHLEGGSWRCVGDTIVQIERVGGEHSTYSFAAGTHLPIIEGLLLIPSVGDSSENKQAAHRSAPLASKKENV